MTSRAKVISVAAMVVVLAVAVRIGWVNAHAVTIPTEHYAMGEWVDLSGSYYDNLKQEDMAGYSMRVVDAQTVSYEEFLNQYAVDSPPDDKDLSDDGGDTIILLTYEIKNDSNDGGGIALFRHELIPERKNASYRFDSDLWWLLQPQTKNQASGVALKKGTSYTLQVPFAIVYDPSYLKTYDQAKRTAVGEDRTFELALCNAPVRKIIDVEL